MDDDDVASDVASDVGDEVPLLARRLSQEEITDALLADAVATGMRLDPHPGARRGAMTSERASASASAASHGMQPSTNGRCEGRTERTFDVTARRMSEGSETRDDDAIADPTKVYKLDQSSPMRVSSLSRSAFSLAHRAYPMLATLAKLRPSPAMEHPGASQHATLRPRISLRLALAPSEYGC